MRLRQFLASSVAVAAVSSAIMLYAAHPSRGSDHQDAPYVLGRPGADITDVFVFPSPRDASKVVLAMDVVPLIPAGQSAGVALDPSILYQFKISHVVGGGADLEFKIQPSGYGAHQTYELIGRHTAGSAPAAVQRGLASQQREFFDGSGLIGTKLGTFPYNAANGTTLSDGIVAYVGPRADPFFFDLFQFFKILPDRDYANARTGDALGYATPSFNGYPKGSTSGAGGYACSTAPSTNALTQINGGFNVVSVVLEIPRSLLATSKQSPVLHLWTTASREERFSGRTNFIQAEVLSRPAVKELFEKFANHQYTNGNEPYNDSSIKSSISQFMTSVAGRSPAIANVVTSVLYPNEMAFDISQPGPAAYLGVETGGATGGKFGGRGLTDDVIDTSLGVVFGNTIPALGLAPDDGKENKCLTAEHVTSGQGGVQTQAAFPFLASPH